MRIRKNIKNYFTNLVNKKIPFKSFCTKSSTTDKDIEKGRI